MNTSLVIFFAWQSDLPNTTNRGVIRNSIEKAIGKLSEVYKDRKLKIAYDEATRGEPGSPNIPSTIIEKIKASDIFICDISTINNKATGKDKETPNPNVLFELGYAVATLGWERIILLFNTAYGKFPDDLPFDIDRHRAMSYHITEVKPTEGRDELISKLTDAIKIIIDLNPIKAYLRQHLSAGKIQRERDIANLQWALSNLHLTTLDEFLLKGPKYISYKLLYFWEGYNVTMTSRSFQLYDKKAYKLLHEIHINWKNCIKHYEEYRITSNPETFIFGNAGGVTFSIEQKRIWRSIEISMGKLRKALDMLIEYIRADYIEIDIEKIGNEASAEYFEFHRKSV